MLTFRDAKAQPACCDGLSRRSFLTVGALTGTGLTLAELLRHQAQGGETGGGSTTSVINVVLPGGPSHLDSYDLKPEAPAEIRGEFRPIQTNVPGFDICELMPRQAKIADKLAVVRNMTVLDGDAHNLHVPLTGFRKPEQRPAFGSIVGRLQGGRRGAVPPYVSLVGDIHPEIIGHEDPLYAGAAWRPFVPSGVGMENLKLAQGVTLDRLGDRKALLRAFDSLRRDIDNSGEMAGMDGFASQAIDVISSSKAREAFDVGREPAHVRARYGMDVRLKKQAMHTRVWRGSSFLLARRLVEAGVRVVSLSAGFWDTHADNFVFMREHLPLLDRSLSALVSDLHERGLGDRVAVVVWGEFFGRSPRINNNGGRDHWKSAGSVLVAGGAWKTGQVVGATDARGARFVGNPYYPQNVLAMLYRFLGIDPARTLPDYNGRPQYLLGRRANIGELV